MSQYILGIDEVGRGVLAGPLTVAGVRRDTEWPTPLFWPQVRDSKNANERARTRLSALIKSSKVILAYHIVDIPAVEVDRLGLTKAMEKAVHMIVDVLTIPGKTDIFIDGSDDFGVGTSVIKGESKYKEIAAASIIAKVHRDRYMRQLQDPGYGFASHKGYGTSIHKTNLERLGPCDEHRRLVHWIGEKWPRESAPLIDGL